MNIISYYTAVCAGLGRVSKYMKTKVHRQMLERPNMCHIFEQLGFKDVKYDIPIVIVFIAAVQFN